jgi:hypothetical protein
MSDDYINLWLVMFLFIIFILYLNYMQNMAIVKNDWNNLKCNPLFMLTNSLSQTAAESSADFQTCINKYSSISKSRRQIKDIIKPSNK